MKTFKHRQSNTNTPYDVTILNDSLYASHHANKRYIEFRDNRIKLELYRRNKNRSEIYQFDNPNERLVMHLNILTLPSHSQDRHLFPHIFNYLRHCTVIIPPPKTNRRLIAG